MEAHEGGDSGARAISPSGAGQQTRGDWPEHALAILVQAEHEAQQLRELTERRVDERIAEADRAAALRVEAAENEAHDILDAAHIEAERTRAAAAAQGEEAGRIAAQRARDLEGAARKEAERIRAEADAYSTEMRTAAADDAGQITREARTVARDVLAQGTELSKHLDQLSGSLRSNSERLLRDVRDAHGRLTAALGDARVVELDRRGRGASQPPRRRARSASDDDDLDVPEFIPGS